MAGLTTDGRAKVPKQPKRIRLPPDPSSTLLQGIYLTVPGHGSGHKLLPAKFTTGSLPHDVSYRLDASIKAKSRSQSPVRVSQPEMLKVLADNPYNWTVHCTSC